MIVLQKFDDLKTLYGDMRSYYTILHSRIREDDVYYELAFAHLLNLPRKFRKDAVALPTAREIVETAVDHISPGFRRVDVQRTAPTPAATENAQLRKAFYESLLDYLERLAPVSPYRDAIKHIVTYGLSTTKFVYDQQKHRKRPEKGQFDTDAEFTEAEEDWRTNRYESMPFTIQVLHPSELLFDPFNDPPQWAVQVSKKYVYDMMNTYPSWGNPRNLRGMDKVEVLEYADNTYRAVSIAGQPAFSDGIVEHKWGTHPYIVVASGLGIEDEEHRPEKRFVGILRYIKGVLLSESRSYSISDVVLKGGAWPVRVLEGDRAGEMKPINLEYGTMQPIPPGTIVKDLTPQLPPQMLFMHLQLANQIISAAAAPRVVRGMREPGTRTGFQHQLALSEARLRYVALGNASENMLAQICRKGAIYMENVVDGPVPLTSSISQHSFRTISGRSFRGNHEVKVKINVMEPEDEVRKHQDAATMVTSGLMSPQTAIRKYFPDVDPESEMGRILAARLLYSPQVMTLLSQGLTEKIAERQGLEAQLQALLQAAMGEQRGRTPPAPQGEGEGVAGSRSDQAMMRELGITPGREGL